MVNTALVDPPALDAVQVSVCEPMATVDPDVIEQTTGTLDVGGPKLTTAP
jgi:hypothetical protein